MKIGIPDRSLEIRPVALDPLEAHPDVYKQKQCEDFLASGPAATASMDTALKDTGISKSR